MATRALVYESELLASLVAEFRKAAGFKVAVALLSKSGLPLLIGAIEGSLRRRGKGEFLVGVDLPTHPDALGALLKLQCEHPDQVSVKYFKSPASAWFHPKFYIFRPRSGRSRAVVGSSNLTAGGLQNNYEASLWSDDSGAVGPLEEYFDELYQGGHARVITEPWLAVYRRLWKEREEQQEAAQRSRDRVRSIPPERGRSVPKRIKGEKFVFTGGIAGWPRERRLYPRVRGLGGVVGLHPGAVRTAACLVHGNRLEGKRATRKLRAARKLRVPIISEDEFFGILDRAERRR
jgi:HKD family nuclease